jgi:hypothetical protein
LHLWRCIQRDPYNWSETMYELYTHSLLNYLLDVVTPALKKARAEYDVGLLKEWKKRWANQKLIVQGLAKLFMYLDRFYTPVRAHADRQRSSDWDRLTRFRFDITAILAPFLLLTSLCLPCVVAMCMLTAQNTDGILTLKEQGYKCYKENIFDQFAPFARAAILNAIEKVSRDGSHTSDAVVSVGIVWSVG